MPSEEVENAVYMTPEEYKAWRKRTDRNMWLLLILFLGLIFLTIVVIKTNGGS
jgi:hypothetical protein